MDSKESIELAVHKTIFQNKIEVFHTSRGGFKLSIDGFCFERNRVRNGKYYWSCEFGRNDTYKCKARAVTTVDVAEDSHTIVSHRDCHNHEPNALRQKVASVVEKIKSQSESDLNKTANEIIEECVRDVSTAVAAQLPSNYALKQIIYRKRKSYKEIKIEEPTDMHFDINNDMLTINEENFVIKDLKMHDNKRLIIFSTNKMMNYLNSATLWIMDSFQITTTIFSQFYVIYGNIEEADDGGLPFLFALFTHQDKLTYVKLFQSIQEYFTEHHLEPRVKFCLAEFDTTVSKSFREIFENVSIIGCQFHLGQILYSQLQSYGLTNLYGNDETFALKIKSLLALSYISSEEIPTYFEKLHESMCPESRRIADWFKEHYICGTENTPPTYRPEFWSNYKMMTLFNFSKTQVQALSWHHHINTLINAKNEEFYNLTKELMKESKLISEEIDKLVDGAPRKKKKSISKEEKVSEKIKEILYTKNSYDECTFLNYLASNMKLK